MSAKYTLRPLHSVLALQCCTNATFQTTFKALRESCWTLHLRLELVNDVAQVRQVQPSAPGKQSYEAPRPPWRIFYVENWPVLATIYLKA